MNAVYGNAARGYVPSCTSKKTRCPGGQKCGIAKNAEVCQYSVWTAGARGAENAMDVPRLLHVDEEVALEDVLPFLVLLGLFVRFVLLTRERGSVSRTGMERNKGREHAHIFPAEYGLTLAAIDVSHGVVACSHLTVIRFTFDNVNPAHIHPSASTRHDRAFIQSYTSSNK